MDTPTMAQIFLSEFTGTAVLLLLGAGVCATVNLNKYPEYWSLADIFMPMLMLGYLKYKRLMKLVVLVLMELSEVLAVVRWRKMN